MSSPTYANQVALGVDNPYIQQPAGMPGTAAPPTPAGVPQPGSPDRERDRAADEPAPVVLPAATKTERFFLTAADQASGSRNERLNMVIRSKYEAGLLKPYNYVKGYARLSRWMDRKCVLFHCHARLCFPVRRTDTCALQRLAGVEAENPAPSVCAPAQIPGETLVVCAVCGVRPANAVMQAIAQSESLTDIVRVRTQNRRMRQDCPLIHLSPGSGVHRRSFRAPAA